MADLFGNTLGVDILAPRKLAVESGRAASESLTRGFQIAQSRKRLSLEQEEAKRKERLMEMAGIQNSEMMANFNAATRDSNGQVDPDKAMEFFRNNSHLAVNPFTSKGFTELIDVSGKLQQAKNSTTRLEANSLEAKTALADLANFNKRLATLADPVARARVQRIPKSENGFVSPEQWDQLLIEESIQPAAPVSTAGKTALDRRNLVVQFGEDSAEVAAFDNQSTTQSDLRERRLDEYISELRSSGDPDKIRQAERHEAILNERGRPKTGAGPRQTPVEKQEADISGLKASLIQSKRFMLANKLDPKANNEVEALQTKLAGAEAKLAELKKQSGVAAPSSTPATNQPVQRFQWTPEGLVPK